MLSNIFFPLNKCWNFFFEQQKTCLKKMTKKNLTISFAKYKKMARKKVCKKKYGQYVLFVVDVFMLKFVLVNK